MRDTKRAKTDSISVKRIVPLGIAILLEVTLLIAILIEPCFFYGLMTKDLLDSELADDMRSGASFCFIGDSITYGTETGGIPWYHHLEKHISGEIMNFSYGGWTSVTLIEKMDEIPDADIYVIAIGINDVLFPDLLPAANDAREYTDNLKILTDHLKEISADAKFYYITPWIFCGQPADKEMRRIEFAEALKSWCNNKDRICIDPQPLISDVIGKHGRLIFMTPNGYHPDKIFGVGLFCHSVLEAEHQRRC